MRAAFSISSLLNQGVTSDAAQTSTRSAPKAIARGRRRRAPLWSAGSGLETGRPGASAQPIPSNANAGAPRPANSQNQSNEQCTTQYATPATAAAQTVRASGSGA